MNKNHTDNNSTPTGEQQTQAPQAPKIVPKQDPLAAALRRNLQRRKQAVKHQTQE